MDIINEYFKANPEYPRKALVCADGFSISVQAHYGAYCQPRPSFRSEDIDEFFKVECGFPNMQVPELADWKDGDGEDIDCVYAYVPVSVVLALIQKHGGVASS